MKIDQVIKDRMDRTLIARGTLLDEYLIDGLKKRGVPGVYIREGEEEPEPEKPEIPLPPLVRHNIEKTRKEDPAKVKLSESVKKRVSEGVQYLYSNSDSQQFTDTTARITNDLMSAINDNEALAVDISVLKTSDEYTFKHSVDVATMSMIIAKKQGLPQKDIYNIGIAGLLHDMGKSKIPLEILNKPARLNEDEFAIMKQHSALGYEILKDKKEFSKVIPVAVLQHHEKMNGKGYPLGCAADQITSYAKILSVADVYDALVTERPYKKSFSQRTAVEMIMSMTEELDITAMRSFLSSVILYPVDSIVQLSNGEEAKVVKNNESSILRPTVVGLTSGKIYDLAEDLSCASILIS
ncbi:MAG: HD-GYP domain-containing protein [Lachnospiraceae bacterium]|nr:HD-GYP domain-containing protein [Lachnospiraceae bacterium]